MEYACSLSLGKSSVFSTHMVPWDVEHIETLLLGKQRQSPPPLMSAHLQFLWMFEGTLHACSWPSPCGGDVGTTIRFQQAWRNSKMCVCMCVSICEWKSKAEAPGAAVIRHQSRALWTASAYDSLPPPAYLLPLSSYSSPRVKMRDIFQVMRCLLHFRQRQGGGRTRKHADEASFEICTKKETVGFYLRYP